MLCRPRTLTPAALAARRANALKSTGTRTEHGKARVALNPLKRGRYAVNLPEKLAHAGYRQDEAEWRRIRARIAQTFQPTAAVPAPVSCSGGVPTAARSLDRQLGSTIFGPSFEKKMDWLASSVWCAHRTRFYAQRRRGYAFRIGPELYSDQLSLLTVDCRLSTVDS